MFTPWQYRASLAAVWLVVACEGCRPPQKVMIPPPPPVPVQPAVLSPPPDPPPANPGYSRPATPASTLPAQMTQVPPVNAPETPALEPKKRTRRAARQTPPPAPPVPVAPAESVAAPAAPAAPAPEAPAARLGQMLSPEQERRYNRAIDQALQAARSGLNSVSGRTLTSDQQSMLRDIQNFVQQAEELRKSDLVGAKGLADKALVLANDLAGSFR